MALERLRAFPHAQVHFATRVTSVKQFGDRVEIEVADSTGARTISGSYLIGADGGRSTVRKAMEIEFEGYTHPERFLILTTTFDIGTMYPGCTRNYISDPDDWFSLFKVSGDERGPLWRILSSTTPEQTDAELMNSEATERRLQRFLPKAQPYDIVHRNLYNVHQRVAASFRKGRVFLAGDAAHVNNPLGGLGLNFGIHDAVELTGLLGQVIRREAGEDILDRYDRHRRPLNIEFVQQQTIANKKRMDEKDPAARMKDFEQLRRTMDNPEAHRAYVRRASLLESVRRETAATVETATIHLSRHWFARTIRLKLARTFCWVSAKCASRLAKLGRSAARQSRLKSPAPAVFASNGPERQSRRICVRF